MEKLYKAQYRHQGKWHDIPVNTFMGVEGTLTEVEDALMFHKKYHNYEAYQVVYIGDSILEDGEDLDTTVQDILENTWYILVFIAVIITFAIFLGGKV